MKGAMKQRKKAENPKRRTVNISGVSEVDLRGIDEKVRIGRYRSRSHFFCEAAKLLLAR